MRELGYTGLETSCREIEKHFERGGEVGSQIRRMGMRLYGVEMEDGPYDAQTGLPPSERIDRIAAGVAKIGAERLILTGEVAPKVEDKLAALKSVEAYCRRLGLRLAYRNQLADVAAELPLLMKKSRDVEFLVDWGHIREAKIDMLPLFQKYRDAISGMHFRDFHGEQQVPLGQGDVDYGPLAKAMLKADWSGWVIAAEEREASAVTARSYLRKLLGV